MDTCAELHKKEKLSEVHSVTQMERRELEETGKCRLQYEGTTDQDIEGIWSQKVHTSVARIDGCWHVHTEIHIWLQGSLNTC